jgi:hypothetical protein
MFFRAVRSWSAEAAKHASCKWDSAIPNGNLVRKVSVVVLEIIARWRGQEGEEGSLLDVQGLNRCRICTSRPKRAGQNNDATRDFHGPCAQKLTFVTPQAVAPPQMPLISLRLSNSARIIETGCQPKPKISSVHEYQYTLKIASSRTQQNCPD